MNRCSLPLHSLLKWGILLGSLWALSGSVLAQTSGPLHQRVTPISVNALRGVLNVVQPPNVLINGQAARLAPGARIRGANNLLVMPGTIAGQDLQVRYTLDNYRLILDVWILSDAEIAHDPLASKRPDFPPSD